MKATLHIPNFKNLLRICCSAFRSISKYLDCELSFYCQQLCKIQYCVDVIFLNGNIKEFNNNNITKIFKVIYKVEIWRNIHKETYEDLKTESNTMKKIH